VPNKLEVGVPRIGRLVDFNESTPQLTVVLTRVEDDITLTIPWDERDSPYARWFVGSDLLSAGEASTGAPTQLLFSDVHGHVLLIGCYARGYHANAFGPGQGTVHARYAILQADGKASYESIHGLQSSVTGLRRWLGVTSWHGTITRPDTRIILESVNQDPIDFGNFGDTHLMAVPSAGWSQNFAKEAEQEITDVLRLKTITAEPQAWEAHLDVHRAMRDLLVISSWQQQAVHPVLAMRTDEGQLVRDGKEPDYLWRNLVSARQEPSVELTATTPHLIRYSDLGIDGIARFIQLRTDYQRALKPILSSNALRDVTPETLLAHTIPGLEALAYLLDLKGGMEEPKAAYRPLRQRFDRILADVQSCLPFSGETWKNNTVDAYNGVKHANKPTLDEVDILNAWRESVLVVRAWVAVELGIEKLAVRSRLEEDPQRHGWVKIG